MSKRNAQSVTSRIENRKHSAALSAFTSSQETKARISYIRANIKRPDYEMIALAENFNALRRDFEAVRHLSDVTWYEWGRENLNFDKNYMALIARLANTPNRKTQEAILDGFRRKQRDNKRKERERKNQAEAQLTENHKRMRRLIQKLSAEEAKNEFVRLWQLYPNRI